MKEPSAHMLEAFSHGVGSPSLDCSCGRTHFAPDSQYMDDEERADLRSRAALRPKYYVEHARVDGISGKVINGMTVVMGCECNWLARFEDFIWAERERILKYFRLRREADAAALENLDRASGA